MKEIVGDKKGIAWGNQIRSYVLQPYRLVKDHRTSIESGNVDSVLDGEINKFIRAFLEKRIKEYMSSTTSYIYNTFSSSGRRC